METKEEVVKRELKKLACRQWYEKNKDRQRSLKRDYMKSRRENDNARVCEIRRDAYHNQDRTERNFKKRLYRNTDGYKANRKEWKNSNYNKVMLMNAKQRAKRFDLEFDITADDIVVPSVCPVLGIPLIIGLDKRNDNSPSLDRFDNLLGYTKANIRVISYRANSIKRDATAEEFEKILNYMKGL